MAIHLSIVSCPFVRVQAWGILGSQIFLFVIKITDSKGMRPNTCSDRIGFENCLGF